MKKKVLHIALKSPHEPNACMSQAFVNVGYEVQEIDWVHAYNNAGKTDAERKLALNNYILHYATLWKPDVIFMQIQRADIIDKETASNLTKIAFTVNWTGDVRESVDWYCDLAPHVDITLFTNETDVDKLRERGFRADYLQVGFDKNIFTKKPHSYAYPEIVFLGNNYSNSGLNFPLSEERFNMVEFLKTHFGKKFKAYGVGWYDTIHLKPIDENICYSSCKIAINQNHFDYKKFSSDRILRIMGSEAFCLTKYYEGIEDEYENKKHLVWWKTFDELVELCSYYLVNEEERRQIAYQGSLHVHENCSWEKRFGEQLTNIINKYPKMEQTKNDSWIQQLQVMPKFKKHSQCSEEGYIKHILDNVGYTNKVLVDIGAWDGSHLSNSKYFIEELGFIGLLFDGDNRGNENVHQEWITKDNICDILKKHNCPKEFDYLTYDTDGNDVWILDKMLQEFSPRVIVCEYNPIWTKDQNRTIAYNPEHTWNEDTYYGFSYLAGHQLAEKHGYKIVFQNDDLNLYFVRKDLLVNPEAPININYNQGKYYHKPHPADKVWVEFK